MKKVKDFTKGVNDSTKVLTGCICMPQKVIQTQNHLFSWDLRHWTPLVRGLISQNIFGLRTVHMGLTSTLIFRLTKQNEHTQWRPQFLWDSSCVIILSIWKKFQNFSFGKRTVHRPWKKIVRKIISFKIFFYFHNHHTSDYMHANFRQNRTIFHFWGAQCPELSENQKLSDFDENWRAYSLKYCDCEK